MLGIVINRIIFKFVHTVIISIDRSIKNAVNDRVVGSLLD